MTGPIIDRSTSTLLVIDLQARLMPAIADGEAAVAKAAFLAEVAQRLAVPTLFTEQNPPGLGPTVPPLLPFANQVFEGRVAGAPDRPA